jgi:hypothetical protein
VTGGATRRSAGGVTMAVYSQPLARPLPPGRVGGQQQHRGREQPNAETCSPSGIRRLRRLRPQGRYRAPKTLGPGSGGPTVLAGVWAVRRRDGALRGVPAEGGVAEIAGRTRPEAPPRGQACPHHREMRESGKQPLWRGEAGVWRGGEPGTSRSRGGEAGP